MEEALDTAVISTAGMNEELRGLLARACETSGLVPQFCDLSRGLDASTHAALFVAVLPSGQRNVSAEVAGLVRGEHASTPVMLVCEEALVGNALSLCDGRLTLVGAPLSPRTLQSRLRVALRSGKHPSAVLDAATPSAALPHAPPQVREQRDAACWVASVCRDERTSGWKLDCQASRVGLRLDGTEHEVVAYDGLARTWSVRKHARLQALRLISPRRFPAVSDLLAGAPTASSLRAASGDLVVALIAPPEHAASVERFEPDAEFLDAAAHGGPELVEFLSLARASSPRALDAVLLEVR